MTAEGSAGERPKVREEGLVVERVDDELLIYDLERDRAHRLNETAALVFDHCDGEHSIEELGGLLGTDGDMVRAALARLSDARLLEEPVSPVADGQWSRRQVLRKISVAGAAGLALPVVTSIVAPTPAAAVTCLPGSCTVATDECCCGVRATPTSPCVEIKSCTGEGQRCLASTASDFLCGCQ